MKIPIRVHQMHPDRSQYKLYDIWYQPENLVVEIEVEEVKIDGNTYYITEEGLKGLVGRLAEITDDIHKNYQNGLRSK